MMKSAAKEVAAMGIRVKTDNPAHVESLMMRSLEEGMAPRSPDQAKTAMASNTSLGRYATPDAVANVVVLLASDEASIVTGSTYLVDG